MNEFGAVFVNVCNAQPSGPVEYRQYIVGRARSAVELFNIRLTAIEFHFQAHK